MKTAAIICEYNPFHNGHEYHIEETKRQSGAESVIALMSGNFVQRGDAAVFDKRLRAEAAVCGGADLVLELPSVYAVRSAEFFAKGAVFILDSLGIVDFLSFGAECPQSDRIMQLSRLLSDEPHELKARINAFCGKGLSYPRARADAVGELYGIEYSELLSLPNNTLAVEYCKALLRLNSTPSAAAARRTIPIHRAAALPPQRICASCYTAEKPTLPLNTCPHSAAKFSAVREYIQPLQWTGRLYATF